MEKSKVYFTDIRTSPQTNLLDKLEKVIKKADIKCIDFNKKFVAIKIHFGEPGNLAYIRPNYVSRVVGILKSMGALPYLTDCNTLPLVADIGIAASFDPVALDMACADLVNNAPAISGSAIFDKGDNLPCRGEDKFKIVHPNTDWRAGLEYARKLGIGNTDYELVTI
jgi:uncharacterized Fe-S center protein